MSRLDLRLVLGRGGKGKSTLALHWTRRFGRVIVCDPNGEEKHAEGARVVTRPDELARLVRDMGVFRIAWRGFEQLGAEAFEFANRVALAGENLCLVWDEVDRFTRAGVPPPAADRCINAGRHANLTIIACSRRPARVPRDLSANASRIVAFATVEPRDLAYLGEFMGSDAAAQLPGLAAFHALDWNEAACQVRASPFD